MKEKCVSGQRELLLVFCRFLAEYQTFILAPKGPKIELYMLCMLDISLFKCSPLFAGHSVVQILALELEFNNTPTQGSKKFRIWETNNLSIDADSSTAAAEGAFCIIIINIIIFLSFPFCCRSHRRRRRSGF